MKRLQAASVLSLLLTVSLCAGCQPQGQQPRTSGESHWLQACTTDSDCPDAQSCICGGCTTACQDQAQCGEGVCDDRDDSQCDVPICVSECTVDSDCQSQDQQCVARQCQATALWICDGQIKYHQLDDGFERLTGAATLFLGQTTQCQTPLPTFSDPHCTSPSAVADVVILDDDLQYAACTPTQARTDANNTVSRLDAGEHTLPQTNTPIDTPLMAIVGQGASETWLEHSITIDANHARISKIGVHGDVHITARANNTALIDCRIQGNLLIEANNVALIGCNVMGDVQIEGQGSVWVDVGVSGQWQRNNPTALCQGCFSIEPQEAFDNTPTTTLEPLCLP